MPWKAVALSKQCFDIVRAGLQDSSAVRGCVCKPVDFEICHGPVVLRSRVGGLQPQGSGVVLQSQLPSPLAKAWAGTTSRTAPHSHQALIHLWRNPTRACIC